MRLLRARKQNFTFRPHFPPKPVIFSVGVLEVMSLASRTVCHVFGLEALVLGIGFDLGVSVMSAAVHTRPLDTPAPMEEVNDYYRARCEMDALIIMRAT